MLPGPKITTYNLRFNKALILRILFQTLGFVLILSGGLWALQGLGIVMWPAESFMLAERKWTFYGIATAAAGALIFWRARR